MNREFVQSSNLHSVGYEDGILEIEFNDSSVYQYFDVPESTYLGLMQASSKGKFFHKYIKRYRYKKVK